MQFPEKKPLQPPASIRKYPLTGGAEAAAGRQTGQTDIPDSNEADTIKER